MTFPYGNQQQRGEIKGVVYDDNQLSETEARAATAADPWDQELDPIDGGTMTKSLIPTRKWFAAQLTLLGGLLILFASHGWHMDEHTTIATITFIVEAMVAYLVPNDSTPGGVPLKH